MEAKNRALLRRLVRTGPADGAAPVRRSIPVVTEPIPVAPRWSACYAPHTSIYFDQRGKARACCQNTGTYLGDVTQQSLREIWSSAEAERMRSALEADDYSEGCDFCAWQVREGNEDILFARQYDGLRPEERRPSWPRQMEFALTNTCNLQCVMCNGEWSSAIRSRRERLPPLPAVYGEAFFEQLAEFLPHLHEAKFIGGEPFLGAEPLRVMAMLAELETPPDVTVITNGTILTPRVERYLAALRPNVIVSIDGASTATYDATRIGAHLPDVLANLDRFRALLGAGKVSITTCLMTGNWREFADVLALAEERGLEVGVNVVRFPAEHSLYQLPADDLARVVEVMDSTAVDLTGPRLAAWRHHRTALRHRLDTIHRAGLDLGPAHGLPGAPKTTRASTCPAPMLILDAEGVDDDTADCDEEQDKRRSSSVALPAPTSRWQWLPFPEGPTMSAGTDVQASDGPEAWLDIDRSGSVTVARLDVGLPLDLEGLHGTSVAELGQRLLHAYPDPDGWMLAERRRPDDDDRFWLWLGAAGREPVAEMIGTSDRDERGDLVGARYRLRAATRRMDEPWPPRDP